MLVMKELERNPNLHLQNLRLISQRSYRNVITIKAKNGPEAETKTTDYIQDKAVF